MARNKPFARKKRLNSEGKSSVAGPVWALLRKFGKRRTHRWRLNPGVKRDWRHNKLKL